MGRSLVCKSVRNNRLLSPVAGGPPGRDNGMTMVASNARTNNTNSGHSDVYSLQFSRAITTTVVAEVHALTLTFAEPRLLAHLKVHRDCLLHWKAAHGQIEPRGGP